MAMNIIYVINMENNMHEEEQDTAPEGEYGIFCEPLGHFGNPGWMSERPMNYEEAVKEADFMCRANKFWHYYAKPILTKLISK